MNEEERRIEALTLDATLETVRRRIAELENQEAQNKEDAAHLSQEMWDEAPHLVYDFNDIAELAQYRREIIRHEDWSQRVEIRLKLMRSMLRSPYFVRHADEIRLRLVRQMVDAKLIEIELK